MSRLYPLCFVFLLTAAFVLPACALLGGSDEVVEKSTNYKFQEPPAPFKRYEGSAADRAWQSEKTGNTIAIHSMCQKYDDVKLDLLADNILAGVDNLNILQREKLKFDGREAERILADGKTDGIPVSVDILVLKKNNCTYDLVYAGRKSNFQRESSYFADFIKRFTAP